MTVTKLYDKLLSSFKNKSKEEYMKDSNSIKTKLGKFADDVDEQSPIRHSSYVSYPELDDKKFNHKISHKKEFNRNQPRPLSQDYDNESSQRCSLADFEMTPHQKTVKTFMSPNTPYNSLLLYHGVGVGKCHSINTPIMMSDGSIKLVQYIKVGDQLMGDDSYPRCVLSLGRGEDEMYQVSMEDGEHFTVNSEHILCLHNVSDSTIVEMTINQYVALPDELKEEFRLYRVPIFLPYKHITHNAYNIGIWTTFEQGIPEDYMKNSENVRLDVLAGIIDTFGIVIDNAYEIVNVSKSVVEDIVFLSRSLGFKCKVKHSDEHCNISILGPNLSHIPVRVVKHLPDNPKISLFETFKVSHVGRDQYYGFTLDKNHRYLMGNFIVSHNTCTAINIAEQYHDIYDKKVMVILSSTLVDNFKKQIFDITKYNQTSGVSPQCTGNKYPNMVLDKNKLDKESLERKVNKIINERYQFIGYKELALFMDNLRKKISQTESDDDRLEAKFQEKLSEVFSDRLIIIDEAHNLRNPTETGKKQISVAFKKLLRHVNNVKLVLMTATPMYNNAKEIVWTLNLLLTNDKRPEIAAKDIFDKNGDVTEEGRRKLAELFRGYVSYMRGENPYAFPFRLSPKMNNDPKVLLTYPKKDIKGKKILASQTIKYLDICQSQMSDLQKRVYDQLKKKVVFDGLDELFDDEEDNEKEDANVEADEESEDDITNDLQKAMQVSNVIYPSCLNDDGSINIGNAFGNKGFEACFDTTNKNKYSYKTSKQFLHYDLLNEYAPKIKSIIDYVQNSKGIVFIYSRYYTSGITPLALALEHIGFLKYSTGNNSTTLGQGLKVKDMYAKAKQRPKYIILSRNKALSPHNDQEIADVKAADNADGSRIKVVIVSKIGTEGIDFKNIREVHLLEPWFNLNRAEQIIGRGVRYCSHTTLPKAERNVTIYMHANVYDQVEESVDLRTYRVAEKKQLKIAKIEQVLKETSIDCNINNNALMFPKSKLKIAFDIETSQGTKIKNFNVGDEDNTYICGFGKCKLTCDPKVDVKNLEYTDESTFEKSYILDDIDLYKKYISKLFKEQNVVGMKYQKILKSLKEIYSVVDEDVLMYTLDDMVTSKYTFSNHKTHRGYLIYKSNQYLFQQSSSYDEKMSIDERESYNVKTTQLPIESLVQQTKFNKPVENKTNSKNIKPSNTIILTNTKTTNSLNTSTSYATVKSLYDAQKIIVINMLSKSLDQLNVELTIPNSEAGDEFCQHLVKKKIAKITPTQTMSSQIVNVRDLFLKLDEKLIDSVLDRTDKTNFENFINHLALIYNNGSPNDFEKICLASLVSSGVFIIDATDKIKYYYNHFENELFILKESKFKKCTPLDLAKISNIVNDIEKKIKPLDSSLKAYIGLKKNEEPHFKIKDNPKSQGYVCQKTSSLTLEDLKKRIQSMYSKVDLFKDSSAKHVKSNLCFFYELMMRVFDEDAFKRPYFIKFENKGKGNK